MQKAPPITDEAKRFKELLQSKVRKFDAYAQLNNEDNAPLSSLAKTRAYGLLRIIMNNHQVHIL